MDTTVLLHYSLSPSTLINCRKSMTTPRPRHNNLSFQIHATNSSSSSDGNNESTTEVTTPGIRFRRGSKKRAKALEDNDENGGQKSMSAIKKKQVKKWEDMSIQEKGMELYVGEKGALFWLNKFAYASIYIMIGAWICFRFVGPALNFYQLDTPPLSPADVLKGSG